MRKAFTLIELVVAVAILAMVISFSTIVFKVSIKAQRVASANMEIMQKMRVITDQLNADLKGHIGTPPGKIRFQREAESYEDNKLHYFGTEDTIEVSEDSIIFFASGDFQSTGQYEYNGATDPRTVIGTAACIYYGLANVNGADEFDPKQKILVRRQTIITPDENWVVNHELTDKEEYCTESLADLIVDLDPADVNDILMAEEELDLNDANDLAMYMAKGVDDFTIQYVGDEVPSENLDFNEWRPTDQQFDDGWPKMLIPVALKFSFKIYDSRGVIEKGRRFTHIVYLVD
ncbi:MAG: PilW family protein [Planctomycetota bacterium]|jgi:prepilin-type N-terminal cleavage/methylation domain-containing protein